MGDSPVVRSLETLPQRFKGTDAHLSARFRVSVGRCSRDIVVDGGSCEVKKSNGVRPDVEIATDVDTWFEMEQGRLSGIEAFSQHKLLVRGSIEKSLLFEPLFERPAAGALAYTVENVGRRGGRMQAVFAGDPKAEPLLMLHGLGGTKSSFLPIVPAMAKHYRVIALDLPGFGSSAKPRGRYDARWFAERVFAFMDQLDIDSAHLVGNSMGGRIAMEMGLMDGNRVSALACLCPATAFTRRPALRIVKLLRPELAFAASRLPRSQVLDGLKQLFSDPTSIEDEWFEAAVDDFLQIWRSPRARMAFSAAARHLYLEEPLGERGFYARLAAMTSPALYVYGRHDVLISHTYGRRVTKALPNSQVVVWNDCGHVPQIEHSERTSQLLVDFFSSVGAKQKAG
jgi:pimeloyl-ACP methyl ester carboxylesterase/putative sterol carrier protein